MEILLEFFCAAVQRIGFCEFSLDQLEYSLFEEDIWK